MSEAFPDEDPFDVDIASLEAYALDQILKRQTN